MLVVLVILLLKDYFVAAVQSFGQKSTRDGVQEFANAVVSEDFEIANPYVIDEYTWRGLEYSGISDVRDLRDWGILTWPSGDAPIVHIHTLSPDPADIANGILIMEKW